MQTLKKAYSLDIIRQKLYHQSMRNFWKYIVPVFITILVAGGIILSINLNAKETAQYATSFEYKYTSLTLFKNQTYKLAKTEFSISPENCNQKIFLTTTDTNIVEINSTTGEIFAKELGNATITAKIKSSATNNIETTINVVVINQNEANITSTQEVELSCSVANSLFINFNDYFNEPTTTREILEGEEIIDYKNINESQNASFIFRQTGTVKLSVCSATTRIIFVIMVV